MTAGLLLLIGGVLGFAAGRWWVLWLGPAAGAVVIGVAAVTRAQVTDTPAIFVAVLATSALAVGLAARRRILPPAA